MIHLEFLCSYIAQVSPKAQRERDRRASPTSWRVVGYIGRWRDGHLIIIRLKGRRETRLGLFFPFGIWFKRIRMM